MKIDHDKIELASQLQGSFLEFTRVFFELVTGRTFIVSQPVGRESHHITISKALTRLSRLQVDSHRLLINVPPGHGKSLMVSMWVAWTMSMYPDSNYLYISYSKTLATKHTEFIRRIMSSAHYKWLFDVKIRQDSRAKDSFRTEQNGSIGAYGSAGSITGQDAGLPGLDRFSGAIIIDDPIKPDDAHSDTIRQSVINNYSETIQQRARGTKVPFIFIGQRVHEDDLGAYLLNGKDGYEWERVILQSLDDVGNALYPEVFPKEMLIKRKETDPYVFSSQFQQTPTPAGGALFKDEWFMLLDDEPEMILTFICVDTAETDKSWNDATVFSFFGLYEIESMGRRTKDLGLHWIDCYELRIEPKDLKQSFLDFYADCMRYNYPPQFTAIEKKSTGVTLISVLEELRGIEVRSIHRTKSSGSKSQRFLEMQPHIAARKISLPRLGKHTTLCVEHMSKITANESHRWDDIADTLSDGIRMAFIEKSLYSTESADDGIREIAQNLAISFNRKRKAGRSRHD